MNPDLHSIGWRLARHIGPEALAALLTAVAVLLVACLVWVLLGVGS
jgi:hypothetical protein